MDTLMDEVKAKLNEADASYIDRCIEYLAYQAAAFLIYGPSFSE